MPIVLMLGHAADGPRGGYFSPYIKPSSIVA